MVALKQQNGKYIRFQKENCSSIVTGLLMLPSPVEAHAFAAGLPRLRDRRRRRGRGTVRDGTLPALRHGHERSGHGARGGSDQDTGKKQLGRR